MMIITYFPLLLKGMGVTIACWLSACLISLCVGSVAGVISCRHLELRALRNLIGLYTFIMKGIPAYLQILIAYFGLPALLGMHIPGFLAATAALGLCSSGYVTEMVRSSLNTISRGQWDAAFVLGYPLLTTLRRIILPQAVQNFLPALIGEAEQLLKSTSLISTIGVMELTRSGMNIISRELNPLPVYAAIALIYLLCSALLNGVILLLNKERTYGYRS
jgi:polar amino acid transport system permease protein